MVNKCSAVGCKSGYKRKGGSQSTGLKVTFHSFPVRDEDLCLKWIKANQRKDFTPSKNSKICSLHFHPSDFVNVSTDGNTTRKNIKLQAGSGQLSRRHLKPGAVPSIFPNAPSYLTAQKSSVRKTKSATSSRRHQQDAARLDMLEQSFSVSDDITGSHLDDIKMRLQAESAVPEGFLTAVQADKLLVYLLDVNDNIPRLSSCIVVHSDLRVTVSLNQTVISDSHYGDLLSPAGCLERLSQLINLMARLKAWTSDNRSLPFSVVVGCIYRHGSQHAESRHQLQGHRI